MRNVESRGRSVLNVETSSITNRKCFMTLVRLLNGEVLKLHWHTMADY